MLLVTGASGQLGNELKKLLPDAIYATSAILDITNFDNVQSFIKDNNIDTIINCAAYTAVDNAEDDAENAEKVNKIGAENLAKSGAKLIHISTDYVFDGNAFRPYKPDDIKNPKSVYGKTKLEGEQLVMDNADTAIIIRTAWLYSSFGNNFVKTMLRLGKEKESLNVIYDQIGTPTFAGDLASAIVDILPQITDGKKGIYHYTNEGIASWYDFATEIMDLAGLDCKINPIPTEDYPIKASRPFYSVLDKTSIKSEFNLTIPHWKGSLKKCLKQF